MYIIEAKTILTPQNGLNIYRGSTDRCLVQPVYAKTARVERPDEVGIKPDADVLLENSLRKKRSRGMLSVGGMADPYNAIEEEEGIMRRCLRVMDRYDFGVAIQTRYPLMLRDLDILKELAKKTKVVVTIPLPTLQTEHFRLIEGELGVSDRIALIDGLAKAGIEMILQIDPVIPFVNASITSLGMLLQLAKEYHIRYIEHHDLKPQLRSGSREPFYQLLHERDPELEARLKERYGESENELVPEDQKELLRFLVDRTAQNSIVCDKKVIQDYRRRYENRTEGHQLSFEEIAF